MVSATLIKTAAALILAGVVWGQQNTQQVSATSSGFRPDKPSDGLVQPKPAAKESVITPEVRGDIYMARKMYREAVEQYKSMPETAVVVNKTGIAYHQMVQLPVAKKYYQRAIKLDPHYPEALNNLGTIYYAEKSFRRAVSQYKRALKEAPESASIWSNLGTAHFARKKYDDAMQCYEKAMALDPDVFEHKSTAGVLLQERSVEERAKFHYYQAKLYAKKGMSERALLYLRKAFEEGLKEDRDKIRELPEFEAMKDLPEFKEIMAMQVRVL
jgi:tetratricopeptide (TPR) repeat protein